MAVADLTDRWREGRVRCDDWDERSFSFSDLSERRIACRGAVVSLLRYHRICLFLTFIFACAQCPHQASGQEPRVRANDVVLRVLDGGYGAGETRAG